MFLAAVGIAGIAGADTSPSQLAKKLMLVKKMAADEKTIGMQQGSTREITFSQTVIAMKRHLDHRQMLAGAKDTQFVEIQSSTPEDSGALSATKINFVKLKTQLCAVHCSSDGLGTQIMVSTTAPGGSGDVIAGTFGESSTVTTGMKVAKNIYHKEDTIL